MRLVQVGHDAKIFGSLQDLSIFSSPFAELKSSKVKYRVKKLKD